VDKKIKMDFISFFKNKALKMLLLIAVSIFSFSMYAQLANRKFEFIPEKYNPKKFDVPVTNPFLLTFPLPSMDLSKMRRNSFSPESRIYLEKCKKLYYDQIIAPDYQVLVGDVRFSHQGAILYCDSAQFFRESNSLYAYGNVHMNQGDTLFLYGAWMHYDGNTKLARVRDKVRLENKSTTLFTDSLNYDRITSIGYYFDGGMLVDSVNELSSDYGQLNTESDYAEFRNSVRLKNPDFVLRTQKLRYNTRTKVADIINPATIVSDSGFINAVGGWYNTSSYESEFWHRSYVVNNHKRIDADTLFYNQKSGIGKGFGKVVLVDSTRNVTLKGEKCYSDEKRDSALMSKNALYIDHSSEDTLFLHADTLITFKDLRHKNVVSADSANPAVNSGKPINPVLPNANLKTAKDSLLNNIKKDSIQSLNSAKDDTTKLKPGQSLKPLPVKDSINSDTSLVKPLKPLRLTSGVKSLSSDTLISGLKKDSLNFTGDTLSLAKDTANAVQDTVFHIVKAFTGVRIFKKDFQAICDTLIYFEKDSMMHFIQQPVLWTEKQQLTGELMKLNIFDGEPQKLDVTGSALVVSFEIDSLYNQFGGKQLIAYFDSSEISRVEVEGNAESIFLPRDEDKELMGFNRMEGSSMTIFMNKGNLDKLILWPQPKGKFYPIGMIDPSQRYLKNFEWLEDLRPKNPDDVMSDTPKTRVFKSGGSRKSTDSSGD
jgi:lipopolysaccharide export system protein LptA